MLLMDDDSKAIIYTEYGLPVAAISPDNPIYQELIDG